MQYPHIIKEFIDLPTFLSCGKSKSSPGRFIPGPVTSNDELWDVDD